MLGEALRGEKSIAECTADKNDEAIRCYEKSITIYRQLYPDGHPDMIHGKIVVRWFYICSS